MIYLEFKNSTVCVSGHREIAEDKLELVRQRLREEILQAVQDGFGVFLSGYAAGTDLEFAKIVADLRDEQYPHLFLEAVIPYAGRLTSKDKYFREMFARANGYIVVCDEYRKDCFFVRNRDMVSRSERVIAVTDGRKGGGTVFTINYAITMEKDVRYINI